MGASNEGHALERLDAVKWPRARVEAWVEVSFGAQLMADLLGRMEVAAQYEGFALAEWVRLPFKKAIAAFLKRGLMAAHDFYRLSDSYRQRAFTVGRRFSMLAIEQTKDALFRALQDGSTFATFKKEINSVFEAQGLTRAAPWHLETVHQNATLGSYQHGRWQQMRSPAMLAMRPYWRYMTVGDARVRPAHAAMNGKTYPADSTVWDSWYPPCGHRCRCSVEALSREEGEAAGESGAPGVEPDEGWAGTPQGWLDG